MAKTGKLAAVETLSPGRVVQARYDAGIPSDYRPPPPPSMAEDEELACAMPRMLYESRYLAANSSTIIAVLDSRTANGIGNGLTYEPLVLNRDGELHEEANRRIRRFMQRWARQVDVTGELSRAGLESIAWRAWDTDGEVFCRQVISNRFGLIPYRLQLLETEAVPYGIYNPAGSRVVNGIELDEWGGPVTYFVDPNPHFSMVGRNLSSRDFVQVPARMMLHLKRMIRPSQVRGLTLLHGVILRTADIADYEQSHRLAARASEKLFAAINRSPDWSGESGIKTDDDGNPLARWQMDNLEIIDNLTAGESVNMLAPQHPNQSAVEFAASERRQIAAGTRSAFSQIAQVFDRSYAAQRLEIAFAWRMIEADRAQFIATVARPGLYEEPLRWALASRALTLPNDVDQDTVFDVRIDGPTMPVIDPTKDRAAFAADQEHGWDSRPGIIRRMGRNPADIDAERAQDAAANPESTQNAD